MRWPRRFALAALAFGLALAVDLATDRRLSSALGGGAILVAALLLVPPLRRPAVSVGAWAGLWIGFNLLRAAADGVPWTGTSLEVVPDLERRLFGGSPPAALQAAAFRPGRPGPHDLLATAVHLSFFVVPHAVAALLLVRSHPLFHRYLAAMALLFATGAVAFALLPTNPPWLAECPGSDTRSVIRVADVVLTGLVSSSNGNSSDDPAARLSFEPNPVASIPSIHLGATALISATALAARRRRTGALLYLAAMGLSLVYLGEHHVQDVVAGGALAAGAWRLAGAAPRLRAFPSSARVTRQVSSSGDR